MTSPSTGWALEHLDVFVHALIGVAAAAVVREVLLYVKHFDEPERKRHQFVTRNAHKAVSLLRRRDQGPR